MAAGCLCFLFVFSALLLVPQVSDAGALLLAAGVGVQAGRMFGRHEAFPRRLRRVTAAVAAVTLLLAVALPLYHRAVERRANAHLPVAAAGAPNVLLIVLDAVRARELSLYDSARITTPHLARRAEGGVVFDHAFAAAPWTLPSHASMFTGRWPHELNAGWNRALDDSAPTLAETLRQRGYATGGFVANLYYAAHESGLNRGFQHYRAHAPGWRDLTRTTLTETQLVQALAHARSFRGAWRAVRTASFDVRRTPPSKHAPAVNREFLTWISQLPRGRPFFAFLNYFDAHHPYYCPPDLAARFECARSPVNRYAGAIAYLDQQMELLFAELERRGVLRNTIVIVTSDHGEQFGENGLRGHGNSLYLPALHVPLVIWGPAAIARGRRIAEPVSLRDLPATIAQLTGTAGLPGTPLTRHWTAGGAAHPARVERGATQAHAAAPVLAHLYPNGQVARRLPARPMTALLTPDVHYIRNGDGQEELYAYRRDPGETINLVRSPDLQSALEELRRSLAALTLR
jgi:arylsulfatase A-like enzyme